jgi:diguanylate cyclase (GGDEF)-like protein/PAS domain S-box-containing protein
MKVIILITAMMVIFAALIVISVFLMFRDRKRLVEEKQRALLLEERYRAVVLDSNEFVFEINIQEKTVEVSENFTRLFSCDTSYDGFLRGTFVHPDDRRSFSQFITEARNGKRNKTIDLRYLVPSGDYVWCATHVTALTDESGRLQRIVGKLSDVDDKKRETELLQERVHRDSMTGLYNKKASEEIIRAILDKDTGSHGLFMIDIDDLKGINDTRGHVYGDEAIIQTAAIIRSAVRSTDIVGRVGGDEFIAFLPKIDCIRACAVAQKILNLLSELPVGISGRRKISCSIGVACRTNCIGFDELYRNADEALYLAKNAGKNQIVIHE